MAKFYYCKDCKESIEITEKNGYICTTCNKSLLTNTVDFTNIMMRKIPMASSTKMEISYENVNSNTKRFKK